ncbi:hypothetical protein LUZ60_012806 [Juncus effusus]|nr:hypothetical protein LUZ60_012806 [Juncus effusus]
MFLNCFSVGRPRGSNVTVNNFRKPETIEEEEEEEEEETILVCSQNANELEAFLRAEVRIRKKIEKENKKLIKELQQTLRYTEFEFEEFKKATDNFAETRKIGEGGYSVVYKGFLRHRDVAIKKLKLNDETGFDGFNEETHIRIALEICCALSFLHSIPSAHGDLKSDNILLDSNYVSKLSNFGTCRELKHTKNTATPSHLTENIKGTYAYMDPEYLASGSMTPWYDVYSFGVVLLQLATGKDVRTVIGTNVTLIIEEVELAIEEHTFEKLVNGSIKWPSKEMPEKIAKLGLQCLKSRRYRPNATILFESLMNIASNNDVILY